MPWFKSWFDSPFYHILYQHRDEDEAERFLDHLIGYLGTPPGARILDLACGKGRHSVYLNEKGFEVTGIDLSEQSIRYCLQFENEKLSFFVHDMRRLFRVNDYDLVLNLFTSIGYFESAEENEAALKNACVALKKGGKLIIDFFNSRYVADNLVANETLVRDSIAFNLSRRIESGFIIKEIAFDSGGTPYHFTEKVAMLQPTDFEKMLLANGMRIITYFGDYDLNAFQPSGSPRFIIVAEKI